MVPAAPGFRCVNINILGGNRVIDAGWSIRPPAAPPHELCKVRRSGLPRFSGPLRGPGIPMHSQGFRRVKKGQAPLSPHLPVALRRGFCRASLRQHLSWATVWKTGLTAIFKRRFLVPRSVSDAWSRKTFHGVPHVRVNKKLQHCVKRQSTKRSANYSFNGIVSVLLNPLAQPVVP